MRSSFPGIGGKTAAQLGRLMEAAGCPLAEPETRRHPETHRTVTDCWARAWRAEYPDTDAGKGRPYPWDLHVDRGGYDRPACYRIAGTHGVLDAPEVLERAMVLYIRDCKTSGYPASLGRFASNFMVRFLDQAHNNPTDAGGGQVMRLADIAERVKRRLEEDRHHG